MTCPFSISAHACHVAFACAMLAMGLHDCANAQQRLEKKLQVREIQPKPAEQAQANQTHHDGQTHTLDTVIITGERVDRSLRHTASSVMMLDGVDLDSHVHQPTVQDAVADVPNVLFPGSVTAPIIRGQDTQGPNSGASAFLSGTVPRATINVDGRYLSFNELVFGSVSIWDVESVEVFRGPQTVKQGANSIAGAIIVKTRDPGSTPEGAAQLQVGSDGMRRASAVLSGPLGRLGESDLSARLSVDRHGRDTFINYANPSFERGDTEQDFHSLNIRGKLLWRPRDLPDLEAKLTLAHVQERRPTTEAASQPFDRYESQTLTMPSFSQWSNSAVIDVDWRVRDTVRLHSRTDVSNLSVRRVSAPFTNGGAHIFQNTASNETRLSWGNSQSRWSGVAGLFLNHTDSDDTLYIRGISSFEDRKRNLGLYAETSYRLANRWLLSAGLRYQRDRVRRHGSTPYAAEGMAYDETFHALLPRLSLAYDLNGHTTVGVLVSKGYNPGGVGLSFAQGKTYTFGQESVWNHELFTRTSLQDGRLLLTSNLFYSDFRNSQRLLPDYLNGRLFGAIVVNAEKARAHGLELAADYRVNPRLRLKAGLGLLESKITQLAAANGNLLQGNDFGRAPRITLSLASQWAITPALDVALDIRHTGSYHSSDQNLPAYRVGAHTLANLRVNWRITRGVELFGFANNLLDKAVPAWNHDDRSAGGMVSSMLAPRQLGLGIKAMF